MTLTPPTSFPANYRTAAGEKVTICAYKAELYHPYCGHREGRTRWYMWDMHGSDDDQNRLVDPPRKVTIPEHWVLFRASDGGVITAMNYKPEADLFQSPQHIIIHHPAREVEV